MVVERAGVLSGDGKTGVAVTRGERRGISYHQDRRAGRQYGRRTAGEIEIDAVGKPHTGQVQRHRPDVFQLDIFKVLRVVRAARQRRGIVHDFGDAQVPLGRRRICRVTSRRYDPAGVVPERERFAPGIEGAAVIALHVKPLTATRTAGAGAKDGHVGRNIQRAVGRHDRARAEGEAHGAGEPPAGEVHSEGVGVRELDVLLGLVAGGRVEFNLSDVHHRVGRLRGGDALALDGGGGVGKEKRAPARQMNVDDPLRFGPHRVGVSPFGPARVVAVGVGCADGGRVHLVHHLPNAGFNSQTGPSAGRLQHLIDDRPEPAQVHAAKIRVVEDQVVKPVGRFVLLGGIVKVQDVVLEQRVGKVALSIQPVASPAQVHVPGEDGPFARAQCVAIEVVIFVPVILVADQRQRDEVTDGLRQIDVVVGISHPIAQRTGFVEAVHQGLQIAEILVLAGFLLVAAGAAHVVVHLVERAVGVPPHPFQPAIVAVLHQVGDAEESGVALEANEE